jgi:hypothetical protein
VQQHERLGGSHVCRIVGRVAATNQHQANGEQASVTHQGPPTIIFSQEACHLQSLKVEEGVLEEKKGRLKEAFEDIKHDIRKK